MFVELRLRYWFVALAAITSLHTLAPAQDDNVEREDIVTTLNRIQEHIALRYEHNVCTWGPNQHDRTHSRRTSTIKPPKRMPSQSILVTSAVAQAKNDLEGCFLEWNERQPGDVDITITLSVTPDGRGHSSIATGGPDSPFLRLCVAEALERVNYPPGPEVLDVEVAVQWSAGLLNQSPRIVGRRHTTSILDL